MMMVKAGKWITDADVSPITSEVPIPDRSRKYQSKYPIDRLEIGDSFTYPIERAGSVSVLIRKFRRQFPEREFTTRTEGKRIRVWRAA